MFILDNIGLVFLFSIKKRKKNKDTENMDKITDNFLCRFVVDGSGKKIGESLAIYNDIIIIKTGTKYLGIPLKHVEEDDKKLLVKGLVDRDKAEEMGEVWRSGSYKTINYDSGD